LELALSLALANFGENALPDADIRSIVELAGSLHSDSEIYTQHQELAEALMTLGKINEVKASEGENPAMRRAVAAQEHSVRALWEQLNPEPSQTAANPSGLKIAKTGANIALVRKQNSEWLQEYDRKLGELVRLAAPSESFVHA
jgi:hypothetical protein